MWGSAVQAATMMDRRKTDDGRLLQVQVGQRVLHIVRLQVVTLRMGKFGMLALVWHAPIGGEGGCCQRCCESLAWRAGQAVHQVHSLASARTHTVRCSISRPGAVCNRSQASSSLGPFAC